MPTPPWTVRGLRHALAAGVLNPSALAEQALARFNRNPGPKYLSLAKCRMDPLRGRARSDHPSGNPGPFAEVRSALWGLPISVKDCFDLAGAPTSCGVRFYRDLKRNGRPRLLAR